MTKFTTGERIEVEVHRDGYTADSITTGGVWVKKVGTVKEAIGAHYVFVTFDDGDMQTISATPGADGYPYRNAARI